jgi:3-phenylpropionate/trans-cinnamate dioxygenase ferredoxin reductase subunit
VIVGSGWIGLETAAAASIAGCHVTVVEPQPTPLYYAIGPELGGVFTVLHQAHGVEFRFGETAAEFHGDAAGHVGSVLTSSETVLPADVAIVAIGAGPNDGLARGAGLEMSNGVVTDSALRTSDPDIYAAGDVACAYHPLLKRSIRVEHWSNARNQPQTAAKAMLGQEAVYDRLPYFYTDQYDLGMEYSGYVEPGGYDEVVFRGDKEAREFVAFWLSEGRVLAGMNVNVWDVNDAVQALIRRGAPVDTARLADPGIPLDEAGR